MYEICLFDGSKLPFKLNHYLSKLRKLCNIIHLTRLSQVYQKIPLIGQGVSPSALIMLVQYPPVSNLVSHEMPELNGGVSSPTGCQQKCCNLGFPGTFGFLHPSCAGSVLMGYMVIPSEATDLCL